MMSYSSGECPRRANPITLCSDLLHEAQLPRTQFYKHYNTAKWVILHASTCRSAHLRLFFHLKNRPFVSQLKNRRIAVSELVTRRDILYFVLCRLSLGHSALEWLFARRATLFLVSSALAASTQRQSQLRFLESAATSQSHIHKDTLTQQKLM